MSRQKIQELDVEDAKIIPLRTHMGGRASPGQMVIPKDVCIEHGITKGTWLFLRSMPEEGAIVLYTQKAFKLVRAEVVPTKDTTDGIKQLVESGKLAKSFV